MLKFHHECIPLNISCLGKHTETHTYAYIYTYKQHRYTETNKYAHLNSPKFLISTDCS